MLTEAGTLTRPRARQIAREMRAVKFTAREIREYLARHGVEVSQITAQRWANPAYEAKNAESTRRSHRRQKRERTGVTLPRVADADGLLLRIRALNRVGVTGRSIAAVIALDYGIAITDYEVRLTLRQGVLTPQLAKRCAP